MRPTGTFSDALELIDELSLEDQERLVELIHHRLAEKRRVELVAEIATARSEFGRGLCTPASSDEIISEVGS